MSDSNLVRTVSAVAQLDHRPDGTTRFLAQAPNSGSSHRKFRLRLPGPRTIVVGLVKGRGPLKSDYIADMIATLRANDLLPAEYDLP